MDRVSAVLAFYLTVPAVCGQLAQDVVSMQVHGSGTVGASAVLRDSLAVTIGGNGVTHVHDVAVLCFMMFSIIAALWVFYLCREHNSESTRMHLLCTSWAACSVAMHVLNKSLVVELETPGCITLVQLLVSVLAFAPTMPSKLGHVGMRQLQYWLVVPSLFAGMLCTGFYTNEYFSLSLLMIIRNLSPLIVLPVEIAVMPTEKRPIVTARVLLSIFIMIAGTLVYCGGIGTLSIIGLVYAVLNMVLGVSNRVVQRRLLTTECKDLPSDVVMFVTNSFALIPTLALVCAANEWEGVLMHMDSWRDPQVAGLLVMSGMVGLGIGYLGFECQRLISATSFVVLQNSTKIVVVWVGIFCFADVVTAMTSLGLVLSMGGSCLYGHAIVRLREDCEEADECKELIPKVNNQQGEQKNTV